MHVRYIMECIVERGNPGHYFPRTGQQIIAPLAGKNYSRFFQGGGFLRLDLSRIGMEE